MGDYQDRLAVNSAQNIILKPTFAEHSLQEHKSQTFIDKTTPFFTMLTIFQL